MLNNALVRCPHCHKISSVGPDFAKKRAILFMIISGIILIIAIGVTVGTYKMAENSGRLYGAYIGEINIINFLTIILNCEVK